MNTSESITEEIRNWLKFLEEEKYKYIKSRSSYERKDNINSIITINVTTPNSGMIYSIAFYYGVIHKEVEEVISKIEKKEMNKYARTMYQYSVNDTRKKFPEYQERNDWYIEKEDELKKIKNDVLLFIKNVALIQIAKWKNLKVIREQLESKISNNIIIYPFKQIIGIDCVLNDKKHVEDYINSFSNNNAGMAESYRNKAFSFFHKCIESQMEIFNGIDKGRIG